MQTKETDDFVFFFFNFQRYESNVANYKRYDCAFVFSVCVLNGLFVCSVFLLLFLYRLTQMENKMNT